MKMTVLRTAMLGAATVIAAIPAVTPIDQAAEAQTAPQKTLPVFSGEDVERGVIYKSADDAYYLMFQNNGDLAVYPMQGGIVPIWSVQRTGVDTKRAARVEMRADGQLVMTDAAGNILWAPVGNDAKPMSALVIIGGELKILTPAAGNPASWSMNERGPALAMGGAAAPGARTGAPTVTGRGYRSGQVKPAPSAPAASPPAPPAPPPSPPASGGGWSFWSAAPAPGPAPSTPAPPPPPPAPPPPSPPAASGGGWSFWSAVPSPGPAPSTAAPPPAPTAPPPTPPAASSSGGFFSTPAAPPPPPASPAPPPPPPPPAPLPPPPLKTVTSTALMTPGQTLAKGQSLNAASGKHKLELAGDGNLIVRPTGGGYVWGLDRVIKNLNQNDRLVFQPDGSLVTLDSAGNVVWTAPLSRKDANGTVVISDAGALQVLAKDGSILWSSDGNTNQVIDISGPARVTPCTPDSGWSKCIQLREPSLKIMGTSRASDSAMNMVANLYDDLIHRFASRYPRSNYNNTKVFMTNGESAAELRTLPPIMNWRVGAQGTSSNDFLRGAGGKEEVWITEQMICKQGTATRNANPSFPKDNENRTFDQVIHEFAHSIAMQYDFEKDLPKIYAGVSAASPIEAFPQSVQGMFGAPGFLWEAGNPRRTPKTEALLNGLFTSSVTYSCNGYRP